MDWKEIILSISVGILIGIFVGNLIRVLNLTIVHIVYYYITISIVIPVQFFIISAVLKYKFHSNTIFLQSDWMNLKNQIILFIISFLVFTYVYNLSVESSYFFRNLNIVSIILLPVIFMYRGVIGIFFSTILMIDPDTGFIFLYFSYICGSIISIVFGYFLTLDVKDRKFRYKLILCFLLFALLEIIGVLGTYFSAAFSH